RGNNGASGERRKNSSGSPPGKRRGTGRANPPVPPTLGERRRLVTRPALTSGEPRPRIPAPLDRAYKGGGADPSTVWWATTAAGPTSRAEGCGRFRAVYDALQCRRPRCRGRDVRSAAEGRPPRLRLRLARQPGDLA